MRRQRCVIGAVVEQADPVKMAVAFPKIAKAAKNNLSTDIPQEDLEAWVTLSLRVQDANVRSLAFTDRVVPDRTNPDYESIRELVDDALEPVAKPTPEPDASGAPSDSPSSSPSSKPSPSKTSDTDTPTAPDKDPGS